MSSTFNSLKKNRSAQFEKLNQQVQQMNKAGPGEDERIWKLEVDKAGNGYAIIRFLPAPTGEDVPFVRVFEHAFKGPGGWYIEKSRTTLGESDPVSEYNMKLWNSVDSDDAPERKQVRNQKRKMSFYSNIYVVKDPSNPSNEGKVFLFKYGKKIYDMLQEKLNPRFEGEEPMNPFDFWEGADFKIKAFTKDKYRTYEASEFAQPGTLGGFEDDQLEQIWQQEYSLQEFIDPQSFKPYEELQKRMHRVLGFDNGSEDHAPQEFTIEDDEKQEMDFKPNFNQRAADPAPQKEQKAQKSTPAAPVLDDEDDNSDFFAQFDEAD